MGHKGNCIKVRSSGAVAASGTGRRVVHGGGVARLAAFVCSHRTTKETPRPAYVSHHALVSTYNWRGGCK